MRVGFSPIAPFLMQIVNIKSGKPYDIYCGRGSIFGNPYEIGVDGTREQVIERYKKWFNFLLRDKRFVDELNKLKGKTLGCFCVPQKCHCEVIIEYLNKIKIEEYPHNEDGGFVFDKK